MRVTSRAWWWIVVAIACAVSACTGLFGVETTDLMTCGDGVIELDEACDDGNTIDGDGCARDCRSNETCGNAVIDLVTGEQCDDGTIGLSNRGCSSRCRTEGPIWRDVSPGPISGRSGHALSFDAARSQVVLFGGTDANVYLDDTWEFDGSQWSKQVPLRSPSPRAQHVMTFDPVRGVTLLYGGGGLSGVTRETWSWDGAIWTQLQPATSPAIAPGAMVFDTRRGVAVMVGTASADPTSLAETWEWDGATWTRRTDVSAPPGVSLFVMAYDEQRDVTVLYGGRQDGMTAPTLRQETWEYDGATWRRITTTPPSTVMGGTVAYIEPITGQGRLALFGGYGPGFATSSETWEWNGATWTLRSPTSRPPGRVTSASVARLSARQVMVFGGALLGDTWLWDGNEWSAPAEPGVAPSARQSPMVFDPDRRRAIIYGGFGVGVGFFGDMWTWHDGAWTLITRRTTGPGTRASHGAAFDIDRGRFVLFGGRPGGSTRLDDTWEWTGKGQWTQIMPPTSPAPRWHPAMTYDAARRTTLLFGGSGAGGAALADTWTWDGAIWTVRAPAVSPSPRFGSRMAYDPVRERVVLFGGASATQQLVDTWEWDGGSWELRDAAGTPPNADGEMVYDPQRRRILLVGGLSDIDLSEYDGTTWQPVAVSNRPPPRYSASVAYDTVGRQLIVFGGGGLTGYRNDTWSMRYEAPLEPEERCALADEDLDGDGAAGCADPDCWARCTPRCPPATSCDPSTPRCGDAECSTVEDTLLCPADCPMTAAR